MKYIIVTGGVVSGLGKGITISSIGRLLFLSGIRITSIKIDPYLNVDAGTMSPLEHGETFVLDDGGETDLDLGNYERFLDVTLTGRHNITSGKIYKEVIKRERRGDYLGKTVQIVPHATDMVQSWLKDVAKVSVDGTGITPDVCLVEVGGTVGDIESMVFLEALRQFQFAIGRHNILFVHVSLVPVLGGDLEQKTKPTQHSCKELMSLGLSPDIIVCRSTEMLLEGTKRKISTFCHVPPDHIISVHNVSNIYHVPLILHQQGIHNIIKSKLQLLNMQEPKLAAWSELAYTVDNLSEKVEIAMVGKYIELQDSYLSVNKALIHSSILLKKDISICWIEASDLAEETKALDINKYEKAWSVLKRVRGVLVPGGFGVRGVEGMIAATRYARENKIPFLGVCLGMQIMVIEYARNVVGYDKAHSTEFDALTPQPMIVFMPEISQTEMGGTMRLGARNTILTTTYHTNRNTTTTSIQQQQQQQQQQQKQKQGEVVVEGEIRDENNTIRTLASQVYGFTNISDEVVQVSERHRHRYEVNPDKVPELEIAGLKFTGKDDQGVRMEIAELPVTEHPFYFGTQFHPEFKSRPTRPSPPFFSFAAIASGCDYDQMCQAGMLWREHESDLQQEIALIYSPTKSSAGKRKFSI